MSGDQSAIVGAAQWMQAMIAGSFVTILAIIALAAFGISMMYGSLSLRRGIQLIAGCFLLLGAGTIANALVSFGSDSSNEKGQTMSVSIIQPPIGDRRQSRMSDGSDVGASSRKPNRMVS